MHARVSYEVGNVSYLSTPHHRRSLDEMLSDVDVAIDRTQARNRELALIEKLMRERAREREPATLRDTAMDWACAVGVCAISGLVAYGAIRILVSLAAVMVGGEG